MPRRLETARRTRALAALAVVLSPLAAIATGCADDPLASPMRHDAGAPSSTLGDSVCPRVAPDAGTGCDQPEGTTCAFGACGSSIAECTRGRWRYSGNPPPRPPCPQGFPASDSVCPPCWPSGVECTYGSNDCSAPDASAKTTVASCVDGGAGQPQRWAVRTFACASTDAGANVQRDAEPDAD